MFFRFAAGLLLVVLVSMVGVRLEKQTLEMRRAVSVQYYQTDLLLELLVRLRLETQRLTAPAQLAATMEEASQTQSRKASRSESVELQRQRAKARVAAEDRKLNRSSKERNVRDRNAEKNLPLLRFRHPFNPQGID